MLGPDEFVLPGLVDTHIHASQFPNAGLALDLTLLDWLERYTFPTERGLAQLPKAQEVCCSTTHHIIISLDQANWYQAKS